MLLGQGTELAPAFETERKTHDPEQLQLEEVIVSMHATSQHQHSNTMRFKGQLGKISIFALIDSGSIHSFINPMVFSADTYQIHETKPMVVMVANGEHMVTDSKCASLNFSIQGFEFLPELRLLPIK
jgi:Retroviral aspartyl protease